MLTQHDLGPDARLPKRFAGMDIKDLIKDRASPPPRRDASAPASHQSFASTNHFTFTSSVSLPPLSAQSAPHFPSPSDLSRYSQGGVNANTSQSHHYYPVATGAQHSSQQGHMPVYQSHQSFHQPGHWPAGYTPSKRPSPPDNTRPAPPPKKQAKWNPEEDQKIIAYRGQGMKWSEISARLCPRTEIACRLHYQNYLEKRSDWDEEKKNKLARVYERVKEDMWKLVANEMKIPWRSAEGMHWIMGETEMARRANVSPFSGSLQPTSDTNSCMSSYNNNNGRRAQSYREAQKTIVFDAEQLAALNAAPLAPAAGIQGPISTFPGVQGAPRGSIASSASGSIEAPPSAGPHGSSQHANATEDLLTLSPRNYEAMRERGVLLPSVADMECMVPISASRTSSVSDRGRRKNSESSNVSGVSSHPSGGVGDRKRSK